MLIPLTFPSQPISFAEQHQKEEGTSEDLFTLFKEEFEKQNDRITLLELQNRNQHGEIGFLKKRQFENLQPN